MDGNGAFDGSALPAADARAFFPFHRHAAVVHGKAEQIAVGAAADAGTLYRAHSLDLAAVDRDDAAVLSPVPADARVKALPCASVVIDLAAQKPRALVLVPAGNRSSPAARRTVPGMASV